jgi:NAD(P)-dependent dehydrogenase (short-subunit alcohol dehydrogenase family)
MISSESKARMSVTFLTGASSGIGRSLVLRLALQGETIAMTLRYSHLSPDHKRKVIQALESKFSEKSPINFQNIPHFSPLSEIKKAV